MFQGGGRQYFDSADYTLQKGAKGNPLMKKNEAATQVPVHKATEGGSPREAAGKTKKRLSNTVSSIDVDSLLLTLKLSRRLPVWRTAKRLLRSSHALHFSQNIFNKSSKLLSIFAVFYYCRAVLVIWLKLVFYMCWQFSRSWLVERYINTI